MTESEFKQWFTGFVEGIEGKTPSAKQWAKIQERVSEITGTPIVQNVFYERYWWPYYNGPYYSVCGQNSMLLSGTARSEEGAHNAMSLASSGAGQMLAEAKSAAENMSAWGGDVLSYEPIFDANDAMYALGRADAQST